MTRRRDDFGPASHEQLRRHSAIDPSARGVYRHLQAITDATEGNPPRILYSENGGFKLDIPKDYLRKTDDELLLLAERPIRWSSDLGEHPSLKDALLAVAENSEKVKPPFWLSACSKNMIVDYAQMQSLSGRLAIKPAQRPIK